MRRARPFNERAINHAASATGSISVGSSFAVRELLMRFETGRFVSICSAAAVIKAAGMEPGGS